MPERFTERFATPWQGMCLSAGHSIIVPLLVHLPHQWSVGLAFSGRTRRRFYKVCTERGVDGALAVPFSLRSENEEIPRFATAIFGALLLLGG